MNGLEEEWYCERIPRRIYKTEVCSELRLAEGVPLRTGADSLAFGGGRAGDPFDQPIPKDELSTRQ